MSALLVLCLGFVITAVAGDLLSRTRKVPAALSRLVIVHAIGVAIVVAQLAPNRMGALPILIFWSSALLVWLGARSHVESSILLRMIHMLRRGAMTGNELTTQYQSYYGAAKRTEDLLRAELLRLDPQRGTMRPTRKGRLIARLVVRLR